LHAVNGAIAGVAFVEVDRMLGGSVRRNALAFGLAEHFLLFPLSGLSDRFHPARDHPDIAPIASSGRAFALATWRHILFGFVLGRRLGGERQATESQHRLQPSQLR
jgi:hypothetical protein